nr:unnamed protein product [Naegleria fowleri]
MGLLRLVQAIQNGNVEEAKNQLLQGNNLNLNETAVVSTTNKEEFEMKCKYKCREYVHSNPVISRSLTCTTELGMYEKTEMTRVTLHSLGCMFYMLLKFALHVTLYLGKKFEVCIAHITFKFLKEFNQPDVCRQVYNHFPQTFRFLTGGMFQRIIEQYLFSLYPDYCKLGWTCLSFSQKIFPSLQVTPLYAACHFGLIEVVKILIEKGANVNQINYGYGEDWSPLHVAVYMKHKDVIELLIANHADLNYREKFNRTPLDLAKQVNASEEIIQLLNGSAQ